LASAHPEFNPITTNRYLKIDLLTGSELRLAYTVMYGDAPAIAARKEADRDANGSLDPAEAEGLGARLRDRVAGPGGLSVTVDGVAATLAFEAPAVGLMGTEVGPSPLSVDLVARVPCPGPGPHLVRFDDHLELGAGESEVRIEESPSTTLLDSYRGPPVDAPDGGASGPPERLYLFRGARRTSLEDRSISLRFVGHAPPAPPAPARTGGARWPWAAAIALLLLGAGVLGYRRMKG